MDDKDGIIAVVTNVQRRLKEVEANGVTADARKKLLGEMSLQLRRKMQQCQRAIHCHSAQKKDAINANAAVQTKLDCLKYYMALLEGSSMYGLLAV